MCRLSKRQVRVMRESGVPLQLINGRNDLVAGVCWVKKLAKALKCPLILTGKALATHSEPAVQDLVSSFHVQASTPSSYCALH